MSDFSAVPAEFEKINIPCCGKLSSTPEKSGTLDGNGQYTVLFTACIPFFSFILGTSFPKKRFTEEEENETFRALGLTPTSTLTVIPKHSTSSSGPESYYL